MWASEEHRRLQATLLQVSHNNLPWLKINESIFQTFWKEEGLANFLLAPYLVDIFLNWYNKMGFVFWFPNFSLTKTGFEKKGYVFPIYVGIFFSIFFINEKFLNRKKISEKVGN